MDERRRSERLRKRRERSPESSSRHSKKQRSRKPESNEDTAAVNAPRTDNFFSPSNHDFYNQQPYCPLDKSKGSIRLLQVSREPVTEKRIFTLTEERRLTDARDTYTAIAYCAGDPKNTREIIVNGIRFNAFANLARAIDGTCHYRESTRNETTYLLWADQICINQSDPSERSHQVGMMYDVYENAKEVAVCLSSVGIASTDNGACGWIRQLHQGLDPSTIASATNTDLANALLAIQNSIHAGWDLAGDAPNVRIACTIIEHITETMQSSMQDETYLSGLANFLKSLEAPWWTRAWVAQEFIASRSAVFIIGLGHVPSEQFIAVVAASILLRKTELRFAAGEYGRTAEERWITFKSSFQVWNTLELVRYVQSEANLLRVLKCCSKRSASDKRDHVYAYLGFIDRDYAILPDYADDNSVEHVLEQTAWEIIRHHKDLEIFEHAAVPRETDLKLPSWVPDWTRLPVNAGSWFDLVHPYSNEDPEAEHIQEGSILSVKGAFLGSIETRISHSAYYGFGCYINRFQNELMVDDEAWLLYGTRTVYMLRQTGATYRLISNVKLETASGEKHLVDTTRCKPTRIHIS